jgi:hypothetical protein
LARSGCGAEALGVRWRKGLAQVSYKTETERSFASTPIIIVKCYEDHMKN